MKIVRVSLFGFLIWLIPFITAFPFYGPRGELNIDFYLFKSIMILILVLTTAFLSVIHLKKTWETDLNSSLITGLLWLAIPIILDFLILIPIAGMNTSDYLMQIGMRYLVVPMIVISHGRLFKFIHQ